MNVINEIPSYLITVTASVAFFIALKLMQNFIHAKVIHAKTETSRAAWSCAAQLADNAVASLVGKDMAGHEKFRQATDIVQQALQKQGIKNIDLNAIETLVQSAYENNLCLSAVLCFLPHTQGLFEAAQYMNAFPLDIQHPRTWCCSKSQ